MNEKISILSLVVAILAVFVGPILAWLAMQHQIESSREIATNQLITPMRQAWINSLRDLLAELVGGSLHYYVAGFEKRDDSAYQELALLQHKITFMLNPDEADHAELEKTILRLIRQISDQGWASSEFPNTHTQVISLGRRVLKREWRRVKSGELGDAPQSVPVGS